MNDNTIQIFHNPGCSKSRAALKILQQRILSQQILEQQMAPAKAAADGLKLDIVRYLDIPPDRTTLCRLLALLDCSVHDILRSGDALYRELGLGPDIPEQKLLDVLEVNPALLQRPIVVFGNKAVIGRPPENVLAIL